MSDLAMPGPASNHWINETLDQDLKKKKKRKEKRQNSFKK